MSALSRSLFAIVTVSACVIDEPPPPPVEGEDAAVAANRSATSATRRLTCEP